MRRRHLCLGLPGEALSVYKIFMKELIKSSPRPHTHTVNIARLKTSCILSNVFRHNSTIQYNDRKHARYQPHPKSVH